MKLSKEWFAEIIPDLYSGGISYKDAINYLTQFVTLSKEDKLWCKKIWRNCESNSKKMSIFDKNEYNEG